MEYFLNIANASSYGYSTYIAMFTAGVIGGFSHCVGMCSPFNIAIATNKYQQIAPEKLNEVRRAKASLIFPYHLGRIFTYAFLAFASAYLASQVSRQEWFYYAKVIMVLVACFFFIGAAFNLSNLNKYIKLPYSTKFFADKSKIFFGKTDFLSTFTLGVVLGFLPCGLIYGALMVSAATANVVVGTLAVIAFGFGTIVPLFLTTYGAGFFVKKLRFKLKKLTPILMGFNGLVLLFTVFKFY